MKLKRYACIWDRVDVSSLCVWTQERYDTMEWSERIWVTKPLVQLKDKSKAASIWDGMSKWFRVLVSLLFNHKLCMCLSWREEKEARKSCISKLYKGKLKKHVKFKAVHFVDFNGLMVPLKLNISFEAIQCMYICFYGPYLLLSSWASLNKTLDKHHHAYSNHVFPFLLIFVFIIALRKQGYVLCLRLFTHMYLNGRYNLCLQQLFIGPGTKNGLKNLCVASLS